MLSEAKELINKKIDVEELSHQYMIMTKTIIENQIQTLPTYLFRGLCDIGYKPVEDI